MNTELFDVVLELQGDLRSMRCPFVAISKLIDVSTGRGIALLYSQCVMACRAYPRNGTRERGVLAGCGDRYTD